METQQYLQQISRLDRMIKNKIAEIAELKELACSISAINTDDKVKSTPNFDKIGSNIAKIQELEYKLDVIIDEYVDKRNLIMSQIESIEDEIQYQILFARYIQRKKFEEIAVEIKYSYKQTRRLHTKALKTFKSKFGEKYSEK